MKKIPRFLLVSHLVPFRLSVIYKFVLKDSSHNSLLLLFFLFQSQWREIIFPKNLLCSLSITPICVSMAIGELLHNIKHITPNNCIKEGLFCILILPLFLMEKNRNCDTLLETFPQKTLEEYERLHFPCFLFSFFLGFYM